MNRLLALAAALLIVTAQPVKADPPVCNVLGDLFNAVTLQPSCYERIRKYNYDHSERAVVNLNEIYGAHSPENPPENYYQINDSFGNDAWMRKTRGW